MVVAIKIKIAFDQKFLFQVLSIKEKNEYMKKDTCTKYILWRFDVIDNDRY